MSNELFYGTSGPVDAEIVLVGEAWGAEEARQQKPFVGQSGNELFRILAEAFPHVKVPDQLPTETWIDYRNRWLTKAGILLTNVAAIRPSNNEMWRLFNDHREEQNKDAECIRGLYPTGYIMSELQRLYSQIRTHRRRLVIACGNYPLWALTNCTGVDTPQDARGRRVPTGISNWRGSMYYMLDDPRGTDSYSDIKLLPILHPASIMRNWSTRAVTVHDLKTRVPMSLNGEWRWAIKPTFLAPPTYEQVEHHLQDYLKQADERAEPLPLVGDVETRRCQLTCFGITHSKTFGMAIPFVKPDGKILEPYWELSQEVKIVRLLTKLLNHPNVLWIGQFFTYDCGIFQEYFGTQPRRYDDTMLMHHLMFPGTPKTLEYLASLYNKVYWFWKEDSKEWDLRQSINQLLEYNCLDLIHTFEAWEELQEVLKQVNMLEMWNARKRHLGFARRMMRRGVLIDKRERQTQAIHLIQSRDEIYAWLHRLIPQEWIAEKWEEVKGRPFKSKTPWYAAGASEQQKILFRDILGCNLPNNRKTGRPTLGKEALNELPSKYPMLAPIFSRMGAARSLDVFHSHFITAPLDYDGRMRSTFNPGGTETFRFNSAAGSMKRGTNLQNVPEGSKDE